MTDRVSMFYDDGSKTDFNDVHDAVVHAHVQGTAGITEVKGEDGKRVLTRKQLEDRVAQVREQAPADAGEAVVVARKIGKEK